MAISAALTINEAVEQISRRKYFLPAIQREFVWSSGQIEELFDSIMKEYPIGMFLFWEINHANVNDYQFYDFIQKYNEFDKTHNQKVNTYGESDITAVLDGQQRLTALYIGLKGSYAYKTPHKRWDNPSAFPERKLHLNLLSKDEVDYDFKFLTDEESKKSDGAHWFYVSEILNMKQLGEVNRYLKEHNLGENESASDRLSLLSQVIHQHKSITPFVEKSAGLDKVLNIFIRVNRGGTHLSYSDLLLSTATAVWQNKDAREEITQFVDEICSVHNKHFNFDKDFVLKSSLVLSDIGDIAFKVDNFNRENMTKIEEQWDEIKKAIKTTVTLISNFGYAKETLLSNNALIPIAYYIYKIGNPDNFCESQKYQKDRQLIFKWLVMALFRRTFGGQSDTVLRSIRATVREHHSDFPVKAIADAFKGTAKSLTELDEDDMDNILRLEYAKPYTFSMLAFIYPHLDLKHVLHQDHIFPKKDFTQKNLEKRGYSQDDIDFYLENYNCMANLQLIEGTMNQEKSGQEFSAWIDEKYPDERARKAYMERHYIPDVDFSLDNFREFITEREKLIRSVLEERVRQQIS